MKLYHRDIGFPPILITRLSGWTTELKYGPHARRACLSDKYGVITRPPRSVTLTADNLVEVETGESGEPRKAVVRVDYDKDYDLVLTLGGFGGLKDGFVRTCWLNEKNDHHFSLDKSKYCAII